MRLFIREKIDGRRAPGYGIYLMGGCAAVAAVLALHARAVGGSWGSPAPRRARASDVASLTEAAAAIAPVKVAPKRGATLYLSNDRGSPREGNPAGVPGPAAVSPEAFNPIAAALAAGPSGAAAGPSQEPAYARLLPSFGTVGAGKQEPSPASLLLGYRDGSADLQPPCAATLQAGPAAAGTSHLVPKGTLIPAYLLTDVDTADPAAILQFAAAATLVFNHREQLPFGTRFLGALAGPAMRDRLDVAVDTILYPDGLELPVRGSCVEADAIGSDIRPGVGAVFHPPPAWVQVAPYFSDFVTGYLGLLASRNLPQVTFGTGGVSVQSSGLASPQAQLYQASSQAIQGFTEARLKEFEQRYAAHYVIPAGTACWLQLTADLDLGPAHPGPRAEPADSTRTKPNAPPR